MVGAEAQEREALHPNTPQECKLAARNLKPEASNPDGSCACWLTMKISSGAPEHVGVSEIRGTFFGGPYYKGILVFWGSISGVPYFRKPLCANFRMFCTFPPPPPPPPTSSPKRRPHHRQRHARCAERLQRRSHGFGEPWEAAKVLGFGVYTPSPKP